MTMTPDELKRLREFMVGATDVSLVMIDVATLRPLLDHIARLEREAKAGRELRDSAYGTMTIYHGFLPEHFRSQLYSTIKTYDDTATKETGQ